jgi:predicted PurR-regulated permease PerM
MKELYEQNKLFFIILIIASIGFLAWYFSEIILCIIVAAVISIIGYPFVEFLGKIRIGKFTLPHALNVILTLMLIIAVLSGMLSFFIPLAVNEATMISSINWHQLFQYYDQEITAVENMLTEFGIIEKATTIDLLIKENFSKFIDFSLFSNIITNVISFTSTFFFNVLTIIFLSFFFLNDPKMLPNFILLLIPVKYSEQSQNVMNKSKTLMSRYFIGLIINVLVMIISYAVTLSIAGVKGALVIAFFGGIVNIIPYIGPFIAVLTGVVLGVTGVVSMGLYGAIATTAIHIVLAMVIVILLDNFLYGPLIQGKSVKAHPVEIFLVIIAAASIGGIPAMIAAVPAYAFLRIIATEFLSQLRLVRRLNR